MPSSFTLNPLTPTLRPFFAALWLLWFRDTVGRALEPEDVAAVDDPEAFYVAPGGAVFFAVREDGEPVGLVAVKVLSAGVYEFCKLVVRDDARGMGVGRALVERCIEFVGERGGGILMLQSIKNLTAALALYERLGFQHMKAPAGMNVLERTEVIMGMQIEATQPHPAPIPLLGATVKNPGFPADLPAKLLPNELLPRICVEHPRNG